ncbi:MAG: alcohol dehydrogenase catalytic domain-containing protein [Verrucomicrobiae bacterium]|nr:alcohol dehydrogenase catalytic domain-containing protein [Verrucomicrobiae bacterium]
MKAAVLYGKEDVRIEDIPEPPLKPGEVRVRIEAALTCGTDLKVYRRGYHAKMITPPSVFGHELAGVIVEKGPSVGEWHVGDRVVVGNSAPCGQCRMCTSGQPNLCDDLQFLNGAYAESVVVPERIVRTNMLKLNPSTGFADAALAEPLACVVLGVQETGLTSGERVLVVGTGPIGLMFVCLASRCGCEVTAVGRGDRRLEAAARLGAKTVVDVTNVELSTDDAVKSACPEPFDAVIEAVGKPEVWEAASRLVRKGGRVNFFGGCPSGTRVSFDTCWLHYTSVRLMASFHHTPVTFRQALNYLEKGLVPAHEFIEGECLLGELPSLFRRMSAINRAFKTVVRMRA